MTGSLISPALRARVRGLAIPIATTLGRLGLTPNALTLIGFAGTCLAALAATAQLWLAAGILVLVFGIFDLFDGTLARATGRATRYGAFLDSTFDRAGEALVYVGLAAGFVAVDFPLGAVVAAAAMAAAFLVSYVRAKAESLGFAQGSAMIGVGLAPREIRVAILVLGLLAAGLIPTPPQIECFTTPCPQPIGDGPIALAAALGLITVLAGATVIQRILHVAKVARAEDRHAEPGRAKEG
ncbi:MAG TPA: CDP-alcohol phosphatidyltransferase family protein [Candidatus Limnocylindrales bacterium]|nr:CDP-alcohol phosphatidyltransferase family protein [Candidatus Limnocylindrales bacterium]